MAFEIPQQKFDATDHARNKMLRANQTLEAFLRNYIQPFEDFWGVSGNDQTIDGVTKFVGNGSRYTTEEMQQIMDVIGPADLVSLLTQAGAFIAFMEAAYPGMLPERYQQAAFNYTFGPSGIVLGELNHFWSIPEEVVDFEY